MDRVERAITKRNEIAKQKKMAEEFAHEFASPRDYKEALKQQFRNSQTDQIEKDKPSD